MRSWKKPTPKQVEQAIAVLGRAQHYRYFFDKLQNPEWIRPLLEKGFFLSPPPAKRHEDEGTISFPPWPESKYLARMASLRPGLVVETISKIPDTDNVLACVDLTDALLMMPSEYSVKLLAKVKKWTQFPYTHLLPEKLGKLVVHLAKGGQIESALELAQELLEVIPDPHLEAESQNTAYSVSREPKAKCEEWDYEEILKKDIPELVRGSGMPALELLCSLLEEAISISYPKQDNDAPDDYSYIWRPAIEDHEQNLPHGLRDALVSALRDSAELSVRERLATAWEVVQLLKSRPWKIFHRIGLHILRLFEDGAPDLVVDRLTNHELFDDHALRHEYALLLGKCFKTLPPEKSELLLGWIEKGPDLEKLRDAAERRTGKRPADEHADKYRKNWQRDRLAWIQADLPEDWKDYYKSLVEELGEPEHPDITSPSGSWVGPTSPLKPDELQDKSVEEIVSFLKDWTPSEGWRAPSPEGLARVLSSVVADQPEHFARDSAQFQGVDPTYVRSLLSGLENALKQKRPFRWKPVLELCHWVVSQPRTLTERKVQPFDYDANWGPARKAVADLVFRGLEHEELNIPYECREMVWTILKPLADDPEPTPEYEEEYGGSNMDPATLSINTVRGAAIHAVIRYGLWVQRNTSKAGERKAALAFKDMPEVEAVLEKHLDPAIDPSLAVRAVYGQWFPWILNMDRDWTTDRVDLIFPREESHRAYREAAWETYIMFCQPYTDVFEVVKDQYAFAIDHIGVAAEKKTHLARPDERLAEHLMAFYWWGKISLDDPEDLLVKFFAKAPATLRGNALSYVGRSFQNTREEIPEDTIKRANALWESRLATAKSCSSVKDFRSEIAAFGWWFVSKKFDDKWVLLNLFESLKIVGRVTRDHSVVEGLAVLAEQYPNFVVQCLEAMLKGDHEAWSLYAWREEVRQILKTVLASGDAEASSLAEDLVHYLGSRGYLEFRNLLKAH
ncbi:hypothetical protein MYX82_05085 [Acidobacteria bacterium AH-259-D05]|nr:hypothetical protein [Acidobacteria bacterium AH-259-D05]